MCKSFLNMYSEKDIVAAYEAIQEKFDFPFLLEVRTNENYNQSSQQNQCIGGIAYRLWQKLHIRLGSTDTRCTGYHKKTCFIGLCTNIIADAGPCG